jgi:serine/threonine protein kinase
VERYLILERIAGGGMGRIYRGVKKGIGGFQKHVVLKQLLPELTEDEDLVALFFREAQIHAALDHANIVHIIDLVAAGRDYYIVMEYVRGTDLHKVLKSLRGKGRSLPVPAALHVAGEVLKALDYAHSRIDDSGESLGIVHRDVSPTNILVSGAGETKLTDFGIAKAASYSTNFFKVRGKAAYMSPEQARGGELDHRSDIYSLGICLYEMLTGRRPLSAPKIGIEADAHYKKPITPIRSFAGSVPPEIEAMVHQALAFEPADRPQTAGELLSGIERVVADRGWFYSTRRLAAYLEQNLGPDPRKWSGAVDGSTTGSPSRRSPVSPQSHRKQAPTRPAADGSSRRKYLDPGVSSGRATSDDARVGKEVTSVTQLPLAGRFGPKTRQPASLPPPKRSLVKASRPAAPVEPKGAPSGKTHRPDPGPATPVLPPPPPPGPRSASDAKTAHRPRERGGSSTDPTPVWVFWLLFGLGLLGVGMLVFILVVKAAG